MTITDFSYSGSELDAVAEATNYYRWIIDAFSKHIGPATVEAGAGIGTVSELILAKNDVRDLLLIEPAGNNVPALRARFAGDARVRVHHGYLEDLAPTLHADTLIAVNVLEHVERDVEFLRAAYTGLVPGGKLLILVPALPAIFGSLDRAFDHYRRYTRPALRSAVAGAGFEIDELHYLNGIGVAAWFMAGRVLRRTTLGRRQVRFYDRFVIPWLSRVEKIVHPPIGQSLFLIAHKPGEPSHGGASDIAIEGPNPRGGTLGHDCASCRGGALVVLVLFPFYRLLDVTESDLVLRSILTSAELARTMLLFGTLIVIMVAFVIARLLDAEKIEEWCRAAGRWLAAIPSSAFVGGLAVLSALLTLAFSYFVLAGKPTLIDAMVQMLQARFVAAGQVAGPANQFTEFWQLQNSVVTPNGWVSQYPPGYICLLALGFLLHVPILVGPVLVGVTVLFTTLSAQRLLRDNLIVARLGAIMLALSPFFIALAGAYMNHVAAAAAGAVAVYCALRSEADERARWPMLVGAALGLAFSVRPLTAIVAGITVLAIWVVVRGARRADIAGWIRLGVFATIGAAPFLVAVGAYNNFFFGNPLRFGYVAAQGPLVGLGFHSDPFGHAYGPAQALAYTSSDLVTLSLYLLETPMPAVIVVGLFLVYRRKFSGGEQLIALWALLPVVANMFYWHHGIVMGPRMLSEAAPAWALLTALAGVALVELTTRRQFGGYSPRAILTVAFVVAWAAGIFYLTPGRLKSYGQAWMASSRIEPPHTRKSSLIFVHGAWSGRVVMRLIANGLRLDSLEIGVSRNTTCELHEFANWYGEARAGRIAPRPNVSFDVANSRRPVRFLIATDDAIRIDPGHPISRDCVQEIASDAEGIMDISSFLWQTDLPELPGDGTMIVRDMGPEANARLIARYPERTPMLFYRAEKENSGPQLVSYAEGLRRLWR